MDLNEALSNAAVAINEDGELPAASRKELLELIEALSRHEHPDAGYLRRARLAIICASEVIEHLSAHAKIYAEAKRLLANSIAALSGKYDLQPLEAENGAYHTLVVNLFEHGEPAFIPAYAGMACFAAVNTVLYDTDFESVGENELDVSPDDWDAGFVASLAASGSAVWEGKGGARRREQFWRWYLNKAIPAAWAVLNVEL